MEQGGICAFISWSSVSDGWVAWRWYLHWFFAVLLDLRKFKRRLCVLSGLQESGQDFATNQIFDKDSYWNGRGSRMNLILKFWNTILCKFVDTCIATIILRCSMIFIVIIRFNKTIEL